MQENEEFDQMSHYRDSSDSGHVIFVISHMTSLISALEQRVEKSLSFDTCKITGNVTLLDKAYLFLELAVTAERTLFITLK